MLCLGCVFLPRGKEETQGNDILTLLSSPPLINRLKGVDVYQGDIMPHSG